MSTRICLPISDAGPNLMGPNPSGPHYANVAQEPDDGDATFNTTTLTNVSYIAGLRKAGTLYPAASHGLTGSYVVRDDAFATEPSDGAWWGTGAARLASFVGVITTDGIEQEAYGFDLGAILPTDLISGVRLRITARSRLFAGVTSIRLTEAVLLVDVIDPPDRPTATDAAVAPAASDSAQNVKSAVATVPGPSARPAAIAPSAPPSNGALRSASPAAAVPYGQAAAVLPSATPQELP